MNEQQLMQYTQQSFAPNPYFDPYGAFRSYMGQYPNQMQGQPQSQQPSQSPATADFIYRPVSNIEEAKAAQIEWNGTVYFFEDRSSGQIYRKQYANDMVVFTAFAPIEIPETPKPDYATNEALVALATKIEELEKRIPVSEDNSNGNNNNGKHGGFRK